MQKNFSLPLSLAFYLVASSLQFSSTLAQVTPDGTTNTTVDVSGNDFTINQGEQAGGNLFHSFGEFSVPTDGSAFFNNAADIVNIFSRVTGGNISNIDGLLGANGTANLFLINPAGIIFGEGARLNIGGSFYGSAADSIVFSDGEFSATDLANPLLLTINAPIGLNFRDNPSEIVNRSSVEDATGDVVGLEVTSGNNLALVGGNINFETGEATARGGNIELGGLSASGTVGINDDGSLSFPDNVAKADITLSNASDVDVRGTDGGDITINARNLSFEAGDFGSTAIKAGITADSISSEAQAGDIVIKATENIIVDNSSISNQVSTDAVGNSGDINISTVNLTLTNGGNFNANTFGQGSAGSINITATNTISIDGENLNATGSTFGSQSTVASQVAPEALGNGGGLIINTGSLNITNGGQISAVTFGQGNAGRVEITARETVTIKGEDSQGFPSAAISGVTPGALGDAGDIIITTGTLSLTDKGRISAGTFGQGNAGVVEITARETVTIDGKNSKGFPSNISSQVNPGALGNAGGVTINTGSLSLTNGGSIRTDTLSQGNAGAIKINVGDSITIDGQSSETGFPSRASSGVAPEAEGDAGGVTINTGSLSLTNGGSIATDTFGQGNAGALEINASDTIIIEGNNPDGSPSRVSSFVNIGAEGDAGGVTINTNSLSLINGAIVSASTLGQGNAGDVRVNAQESITITSVTENNRSGFFANAFISNGNGGDINVFSHEITIEDGGTIEAGNIDSLGFSEPGTGEPGDINIQANSLSLTNEARINTATQSETGNRANINLQIADNLILRNNSFISAQAFNNANGGNITIANDFIIAFPNQNNDIIASAQQGEGGNINITAEALFGIEERPLNDITNDINASSEFGLDGTISIVTPDVNPLQQDIEEPANIIQSEQAVGQSCRRTSTADQPSGLTLKGKGGIPPAPTEPFDSETILVEDEITPSNIQAKYPQIQPIATSNGNIYPARGIIKTESGKIILTAYPTDNINTRTPHNSANCTPS